VKKQKEVARLLREQGHELVDLFDYDMVVAVGGMCASGNRTAVRTPVPGTVSSDDWTRFWNRDAKKIAEELSRSLEKAKRNG
jgi:hypothetical protein